MCYVPIITQPPSANIYLEFRKISNTYMSTYPIRHMYIVVNLCQDEGCQENRKLKGLDCDLMGSVRIQSIIKVRRY
jgi:hypothetical protein